MIMNWRKSKLKEIETKVKKYFAYSYEKDTSKCLNNTDCSALFCCASAFVEYKPYGLKKDYKLACMPEKVADENPDVTIDDFEVKLICYSGALKTLVGVVTFL